MPTGVKLNVKKLVEDLGGARSAADLVGVPRTAPYRWIKTGRMSSESLAAVKKGRPNLDLDYYFDAAE